MSWHALSGCKFARYVTVEVKSWWPLSPVNIYIFGAAECRHLMFSYLLPSELVYSRQKSQYGAGASQVEHYSHLAAQIARIRIYQDVSSAVDPF